MNFRRKEPDLKAIDVELEREVRSQNMNEAPEPHLKFAPPSVRDQWKPINPDELPKVAAFEELPTKEIDDLFRKAEERLAEMKRRGDIIKGVFKKHVEEVRAEVEAIVAGVDMSLDMFKTLHDNMNQLRKPKVEKKKEEE